MKGLMSRYGYVDEVITDNGPQFGSADFKSFATAYGFRHVTSTPHYPQSNGQAERMVQTIKNLIIKAKDPHILNLLLLNV
jgi:transposase InsO family protein